MAGTRFLIVLAVASLAPPALGQPVAEWTVTGACPGRCPPACAGDFDGDCDVDVDDRLTLPGA